MAKRFPCHTLSMSRVHPSRGRDLGELILGRGMIPVQAPLKRLSSIDSALWSTLQEATREILCCPSCSFCLRRLLSGALANRGPGCPLRPDSACQGSCGHGIAHAAAALAE